MSKKILTMGEVEGYEKIYFGSKEKICGIYGIVFYRDDVKNVKIYVGNSVDIISRCKAHMRNLINPKSGNHTSKKLIQCYGNRNYKMIFVILERCGEDQVMQKEKEYQHKWVKRNLLNNWVAVNMEEIKPWLEKAIKSKGYVEKFKYSETNFYNGTPCKESNAKESDGYSKLRVMVDGKCKNLFKHRVAYWEKHGEYPELVRHICDNKCCYNAEHLMPGNYSDNNLDKRGDFPERFEKDWVRLEGDADKLTTLYKWKRNCVRQGTRVSTAVYEWERKLGLREKYHDIYYIKRGIRTQLWKRKDVQEFIQICAKLYGKSNVKIAEALNNKFGFKLTAKQVSSMKSKIKGRTRNRKRIKNGDLTGATSVIKEYYASHTDEEIKNICNANLGTSYKTGEIRGMRFDLSLYKPQIIQDKVGDLYRRDAVSRWGIEAEKLVEHFGDQYSDAELAEICRNEYGEEMKFDEVVIQELRQLIGAREQ